MIFINIGSFLGSVGDSLHKLDLSRSQDEKDTFIDDFIHELSDYLSKFDANYQLNLLPKDAVLYVNEIYKGEKYYDCREQISSDVYAVPVDRVKGNVSTFSKLQLQNDNFYHVIDS